MDGASPTGNMREFNSSLRPTTSAAVTVPCPTDSRCVAVLDGDPAPTVLAGGTDLMVEVNYGQRRPMTCCRCVTRWRLRDWRSRRRMARAHRDELVLGAATVHHPALARAGRPGAGAGPGGAARWQRCRSATPAIHRRQPGTGSPAGDTPPVLVAHEARSSWPRLSPAHAARRRVPGRPRRRRRRPASCSSPCGSPRGRAGRVPQDQKRNATVIAVANCRWWSTASGAPLAWARLGRPMPVRRPERGPG
jgi:hypothetical protein